MADIYNDGNIPFGGEIVTLNGVDYVGEDINFEEPTNELERKDEKNKPNGAVYQRQKTKGTMTLQLSSYTTPIPEVNTVVTVPFRNAPKGFIITKVGQPKKQGEIRKINVEIAEKLN